MKNQKKLTVLSSENHIQDKFEPKWMNVSLGKYTSFDNIDFLQNFTWPIIGKEER